MTYREGEGGDIHPKFPPDIMKRLGYFRPSQTVWNRLSAGGVTSGVEQATTTVFGGVAGGGVEQVEIAFLQPRSRTNTLSKYANEWPTDREGTPLKSSSTKNIRWGSDSLEHSTKMVFYRKL